jgi:hypothetical protein
MSLVRSMINQVGREIGKDIYKSFGKKPESNYSFHQEVINFELSTYDKVSLRNLANLVEKAESISHRNFEFEQVFLDIDKKIDFAKENLPKEFQSELERLDNLNLENLESKRLFHKVWVGKEITEQEERVSKLKDIDSYFPYMIKGVWLNLITFVVIFLLYKGDFTISNIFELEEHHSKNIPSLWACLIFVFFWIPSVLYRFFNKQSTNVENEKERNNLNELKNYHSSI